MLTLINTTCVRDTNTCLTASGAPAANYNGAAIVLAQGQLKVYNSLIANHYATSARADLYLSDKATLLAEVHTIYSPTSPDEQCLGAITYQDDMPYIPLLTDSYAGIPLVCLAADDLSEQTFGEDINGNGTTDDSLTADALGNVRSLPATIGAVEYHAPQALPKTEHTLPTVQKFLNRNQIRICIDGQIYDLLGHRIEE